MSGFIFADIYINHRTVLVNSISDSSFIDIIIISGPFLRVEMASSSALTLDDLEIPSTSSLSAAKVQTQTHTVDDHLFYPSVEDKDLVLERSKSPVEEQPRQILKDRLYVGNLHPTVDECVSFLYFLSLFSPFVGECDG